MDKSLRNQCVPEVEKLCVKEFGKLPKVYWRFHSFGHRNYYIEFDDDTKYVLKIYIKGKFVSVAQDDKLRTEYLCKSEYYKKLVQIDTPKYTFFKYINGKCLSSADVRDQTIRLLCMKRLAEFHRIGQSKNPNDHFFFDIWKKKEARFERIRKNFSKNERKEQVERILSHLEFFVKELFMNNKFKNELVYCHNDIFSENILWDTVNKKYMIIDFEDIGFSNFLSDISDFMLETTLEYSDNEMTGYKRDLSCYPKMEEVKRMIRFYLFFYRFGDKYFEGTDLPENIEIYENDSNMKKITKKEVDKYYEQWDFNGALMACKWVMWAFYEYKREGFKLDYASIGFDWYSLFQLHMNNMGYDVSYN